MKEAAAEEAEAVVPVTARFATEAARGSRRARERRVGRTVGNSARYPQGAGPSSTGHRPLAGLAPVTGAALAPNSWTAVSAIGRILRNPRRGRRASPHLDTVPFCFATTAREDTSCRFACLRASSHSGRLRFGTQLRTLALPAPARALHSAQRRAQAFESRDGALRVRAQYGAHQRHASRRTTNVRVYGPSDPTLDGPGKIIDN